MLEQMPRSEGIETRVNAKTPFFALCWNKCPDQRGSQLVVPILHMLPNALLQVIFFKMLQKKNEKNVSCP
jgi:hypothetical protein